LLTNAFAGRMIWLRRTDLARGVQFENPTSGQVISYARTGVSS